MLKKLNWQAFSNEDRNEIIEKVKQVITSSEGYITNFNMFSDLAMSLSIEIEEAGIQSLHQALGSLLNISDLEAETVNPNSKKEWLVFINISFGSGTGDLKGIVPDVPG